MPLSRNILIFNHSYGIQFVDIANQYTKVFEERGDKVTVVYLTGKPDLAVKQKTLATDVHFMDCSEADTSGLKLSPIKRMLKLQREKSFEVVICHRYKPTYIMLMVACFYRFKTFISVMHELGTMRRLGRRLIIALLAPKNLIFAGVSNAVRSDLRKSLWRWPPGRVLTLYNMIDVDLTQPCLLSRDEARVSLKVPSTAFVYGNVGRLAINKDQRSLIAAFALVKGQAPEAKLLILGDGQLETELKQQVQDLGLTLDVIFTGFIPEGVRFMKAFDVYVTSSTQEAFGRVLLEAMVAQIPVIATRVNGMPEVLGTTGVLVNPKDPENLAAAMLKLYQASQGEREGVAARGYARALSAFSIPRFAEVLGNLLPGLDSNQ